MCRLPYQALFGGVTALSREHFYALNGYSNKYFGWGGEDDDMAARYVCPSSPPFLWCIKRSRIRSSLEQMTDVPDVIVAMSRP